MNDYAKIEQLHFEMEVNAIDSDFYPENYPLHWHQFAECIAVTKPGATAVLGVNQKSITMQEGDVLLIWPGELHEVIDNSSKGIIALQFPMSHINGKRELASLHKLYRDNLLISSKPSDAPDNNLLTDIGKIIEISKDNSDDFKNIRMTIHLYELFIKIATHMKNTPTTFSEDANENSHIAEKIDLACSYIKNQCTQPLTLNEVASYVGFSPYYFSRNFKQITTHSFVEYLILQRINTFQVLLADKSLSITDAAYQAGFKSISTLNRVFAKYCGCSPKEFRKYFSS